MFIYLGEEEESAVMDGDDSQVEQNGEVEIKLIETGNAKSTIATQTSSNPQSDN